MYTKPKNTQPHSEARPETGNRRPPVKENEYVPLTRIQELINRRLHDRVQEGVLNKTEVRAVARMVQRSTLDVIEDHLTKEVNRILDSYV